MQTVDFASCHTKKGLQLAKNVAYKKCFVKESSVIGISFSSGVNEITKQCNEMAQTIHYLNLHALPTALLESWRKGKIENTD